MIVEFLWDVISGILTGILSLIPEWTLPPTAGSATAEAFGNMAAWINGYFPFQHLLICVGAYIAARLFFAAWGLLVFLYDRFPMKFT